jgi:hypothetical protein
LLPGDPGGWWSGTGRRRLVETPFEELSPMNRAPDLMPVLSRGRHRNAKRGACFMEMASYLAGERWSDHPACTHPLLAQLARDVNDHLSDAARPRIVPLIPDVVGLDGDDPRVHAWIAREAAIAALPVAPQSRQRVAAVGLLACERILNALEGRPGDHVSPRTRRALDGEPLARDWARDAVSMGTGTPAGFARRGAPTIVRTAVSGLAEAAVADNDARLVALLEHVVALGQEWFRAPLDERVAVTV